MELIRSENNVMDSESCCAVFTSQAIALAMAYVAMQQWQDLYDPDVALQRGTLFAQLDKPFIGEEAVGQ